MIEKILREQDTKRLIICYLCFFFFPFFLDMHIVYFRVNVDQDYLMLGNTKNFRSINAFSTRNMCQESVFFFFEISISELDL